MLSYLKNTFLLNPIHIADTSLNKELKEVILKTNLSSTTKSLDVGCGNRPFESSFPKGTYVGVDIEDSGRPISMKKPDYFYDGKKLPFDDNTYDCVLCTQVLEHVPYPQLILAEISRVLKPGGHAILSLPFVWEEHEAPYDFFRFTQFGIKRILKDTNLEVDIMIKDSGVFKTLAMIFNTYLCNDFIPRIPIRGLYLICSVVICFPVQIVALILDKLLPDQRRIYLNLVIRAKKV